MSGFLRTDDANNKECYAVMLEDIGEVMETMQIKEEPCIDDEIEPIETFAKFESATNFKGFEALHKTVLDIDDRLLYSNVQIEAGQMYDELRRTFERNSNKLT